MSIEDERDFHSIEALGAALAESVAADLRSGVTRRTAPVVRSAIRIV